MQSKGKAWKMRRSNSRPASGQRFISTLEIFGHIDNLLRVAPNEIWQEYLKTPKAQKLYTHASMHEVVPELTAQHPDMLEFEQIEYIQTETACAA